MWVEFSFCILKEKEEIMVSFIVAVVGFKHGLPSGNAEIL
jgi:hypothetical protein